MCARLRREDTRLRYLADNFESRKYPRLSAGLNERNLRESDSSCRAVSQWSLATCARKRERKREREIHTIYYDFCRALILVDGLNPPNRTTRSGGNELANRRLTRDTYYTGLQRWFTSFVQLTVFKEDYTVLYGEGRLS